MQARPDGSRLRFAPKECRGHPPSPSAMEDRSCPRGSRGVARRAKPGGTAILAVPVAGVSPARACPAKPWRSRARPSRPCGTSTGRMGQRLARASRRRYAVFANLALVGRSRRHGRTWPGAKPERSDAEPPVAVAHRPSPDGATGTSNRGLANVPFPSPRWDSGRDRPAFRGFPRLRLGPPPAKSCRPVRTRTGSPLPGWHEGNDRPPTAHPARSPQSNDANALLSLFRRAGQVLVGEFGAHGQDKVRHGAEHVHPLGQRQRLKPPRLRLGALVPAIVRYARGHTPILPAPVSAPTTPPRRGTPRAAWHTTTGNYENIVAT